MFLHNLLSHKHEVEMEHEFTLKKINSERIFAFSFQKSTAHAVFIRSNNLHLGDRISKQQKPYSLSAKSRAKTLSKNSRLFEGEKEKLTLFTFSTVMFQVKLSTALLCLRPFRFSFSPNLGRSSWSTIPERTCNRKQTHIQQMYHSICFVLV